MIRFAAIGLNHGHIYGQVEMLRAAGAELVAFFAAEDDLAAQFAQKYPHAKRAAGRAEILHDETIQLIASAAISSERAALGIEAMQHGKDFFSDKPGFTRLEDLDEARRVQSETGRIYAIYYGERLSNAATLKAGELVRAGAIGDVVQTIGLGPHRLSAASRPAWFFEREKYGGILCDIASHQVEQFLWFANSDDAKVLSANVANVAHPQWSELEDFGDATFRTDNGVFGYCRVDWFTPDGLPAFGDGRLTVMGTHGYLEVRKYCDVPNQSAGSRLILVDEHGVHDVDFSLTRVTFGHDLVYDVIHRTQTAMSQQHCFAATELTLQAQNVALQAQNNAAQ